MLVVLFVSEIEIPCGARENYRDHRSCSRARLLFRFFDRTFFIHRRIHKLSRECSRETSESIRKNKKPAIYIEYCAICFCSKSIIFRDIIIRKHCRQLFQYSPPKLIISYPISNTSKSIESYYQNIRNVVSGIDHKNGHHVLRSVHLLLL